MVGSASLARLGQLARRRPIAITLGLLGTALVGLWIYTGVRGAHVELASNNLRALLASETVAVDVWISEKRLNVQRWALDPRVVEATARLGAAAERGVPALVQACRGAPGAQLLAAIDGMRLGEAAASVYLVSAEGRVLGSRDPALCGHLLDPADRSVYAPVFNGETRFGPPQDDADRIGPPGVRSGAKIWISAPVRDNAGEVIAVLDIGKPAGERFAELFTAVRSGATREAYAFDARARMLSESRFTEALVAAGLLRTGESAILRVRLLDPVAAGSGEQPTRLVAAALAARTRPVSPAAQRGSERNAEDRVLLTPYANYLGEPVIGAWRWLEDANFGIAVEVAEREALAPLLRLEAAFFVLAGMVGLATFGFLVALLRMEGLRARVAEAVRVGNYELFEEIGKGGVARVYRAQHRLLKRPTAVKVIHLHQASDELLARFDREVRLASHLMHPNTIEIFDYGRTPEGLPFYAMELLHGLTLQQIVDSSGPLPAARVIHVLRGIAGSLSEAHERGLVHRDVTPANIMLCQKGGQYDVPKLLDFGMIKDTRAEATRDLTRALRVLGTPAYMAPERIEDASSADPRSDVYALGAVAYFALAGAPPFAAENDLSLAYQIVNTAPRPLPARAAVPDGLAALVMHLLAKDPAQRPQSAAAVAAMLDGLRLESEWAQPQAIAWWKAREHLALPVLDSTVEPSQAAA
jgi:hypothetical protein